MLGLWCGVLGACVVFGVWCLYVLVGLGFAWVFVSGGDVQVLIYLWLFACLICLVVR